MNKSIRLLSIMTLLLSGLLANAMDEDPNKKICKGVFENNPVLIAEVFKDFTDNHSYVPIKVFVERYLDKPGYLIYASIDGKVSIVEKLIELGANLEIRTHHENTALISAVAKDHYLIVQALLNAGTDIDATNDCEETALISEPAYYGSLEMAKLLVSRGASITKKNNHGLTAIDIASKRGHIELVNYLKEQLKLRRAVIKKELSEYFPTGVDKIIMEYADY